MKRCVADCLTATCPDRPFTLPRALLWSVARAPAAGRHGLRVAVAGAQAMEPFFSVTLSALFLGEAPTLPVVLSLLPVVGGVALASASEVTFNWPGFLAAMGSNVTFQSRNVFSKKFMGKKKARAARPLPHATKTSPLLQICMSVSEHGPYCFSQCPLHSWCVSYLSHAPVCMRGRSGPAANQCDVARRGPWTTSTSSRSSPS